jgi:hypothetical protein
VRRRLHPRLFAPVWSQVTGIAPLTLPYGLSNDEAEKGPAIYLCRQPHGTEAQPWPELAHLG